jgi:4-alpha-glucanotransferase
MNTPSLNGGNWRWRFGQQQLPSELARKLAHLAELSDRLPEPIAVLADESFAA